MGETKTLLTKLYITKHIVTLTFPLHPHVATPYRYKTHNVVVTARIKLYSQLWYKAFLLDPSL